MGGLYDVWLVSQQSTTLPLAVWGHSLAASALTRTHTRRKKFPDSVYLLLLKMGLTEISNHEIYNALMLWQALPSNVLLQEPYDAVTVTIISIRAFL